MQPWLPAAVSTSSCISSSSVMLPSCCLGFGHDLPHPLKDVLALAIALFVAQPWTWSAVGPSAYLAGRALARTPAARLRYRWVIWALAVIIFLVFWYRRRHAAAVVSLHQVIFWHADR